MTAIRLQAVGKTYKRRRRVPVAALREISLTLDQGQLLVLLGPSGCGKSTVLRSIAGLESPDQGRIELAGDVVFDADSRVNVPPSRRNLGMVFQNFALWPHMRVREIVSFPLQASGWPRQARVPRTEEVLAMVGCDDLADRYPSQLSGGQQQRVALARAMAAKPNLLLFDEPLSNLDAGLRVGLRTEIQRTHQETAFSGVYVTHDQEEALAVADVIAVMCAGEIVQMDLPRVVYEAPATEWVAAFMGYSNCLSEQTVTRALQSDTTALRGQGTVLRFRPDDVRLGTDAPEGDASQPRQSSDRGLHLRGKITASSYLGGQFQCVVRIGTEEINGFVKAQDAEPPVRIGEDVTVWIARERLLIFNANAEDVDARETTDDGLVGVET